TAGDLLDLDGLRIDDRRPALQVIDLAELRDLAGAAGQLLDDAILVVAELVDVDLGLAELDAPLLGVLRFLEELGDVQQRLRRTAPAEEPDTARVLLVIDERALHTEVRGIKGSRVPSGARPNHCDVS